MTRARPKQALANGSTVIPAESITIDEIREAYYFSQGHPVLWELFQQAAGRKSGTIPRDLLTDTQQKRFDEFLAQARGVIR